MLADCETRGRKTISLYDKAIFPARVFVGADGSRISIIIDPEGRGRETVCQIFYADTAKFQRSFAPELTICRLFGPGSKLAICSKYGTNNPDRPAELWTLL